MKLSRCVRCGAIIADGSYCALHQPKVTNNQTMYKHAVRFNTTLYNSYRWKKIRRELITKQTFCSLCGCGTGLQLHHKIRPKGDEELFFNINNLIVVCKTCHDRLTNSERKTD
jgi:5-methylcytosine-specific restriction enzyme A